MYHYTHLQLISILRYQLISSQVSGVDIFPTIANLVDSSIKEKTSPDDKVGIRTQNYKYFRNSRDSGIDVNLYDLKNDNQ